MTAWTSVGQHHQLRLLSASYGAFVLFIMVMKSTSVIWRGFAYLIRKCSDNKGNHDGSPSNNIEKRSTRRRLVYRRSGNFTGEKKDREDDQPPSKRGRKPKYHGGRGCGDCSVWLHLGSQDQFKSKHSMDNPSHPREQAKDFSDYLSFGMHKIVLSEESCLCHACYHDCKANFKEKDKVPRWVHLHNYESKPKQKHCQVCHFQTLPEEDTPCKTKTRWAPNDWSLNQPLLLWQEFFRLTANNFNINLRKKSTICYNHYMSMYNKIRGRSCILCTGADGEEWHFASQNYSDIKKYCLSIGKQACKESDWVCINCWKQVINIEKRSSKTLQNDLQSSDTNKKLMAEALNFCIGVIKESGYIIRKHVISLYRYNVEKVLNNTVEVNAMVKSFDNYVTTQVDKCEDIGKYRKDTRESVGTIIYDKSVFSDNSIVHVYDMICQNRMYKEHIESMKDNLFSVTDVQEMIKKQTAIFCDAQDNLDYRKIFDDTLESDTGVPHTYFLHNYIHKPLLEFMEKLTQVSSHGSSDHDGDDSDVISKKRCKIQMVIAILCNIQNRNCLLMQIVIGLSAYAGGLRDKVFDIFNYFGLSCSIRYIRRHADHWSKKRNILDEIDRKGFWRITFDNLNFARRFAKTFQYGGQVAGRMLNLITGQVSHRKENTDASSLQGDLLKQTPSQSEADYFLKPGTEEYEMWERFVKSLGQKTECRTASNVKDHKTTLLDDIKEDLPSYTPSDPDNISYARVSCAQASNINDVCQYLTQLKSDLNIGKLGYPNKCVVSGDQQTFSLMKGLIAKYPSTFDWIIPAPGDWHLMKLSSEIIRDLLWDGGLHHLGKLVGHHKEIYKWKDIHNVLTSLHESLWYEASCEMKKSSFHSFSEWVKSVKSKNKDQVSIFWVNTLEYLNAYIGFYFAIRSGNWALRNACLPKLTELFFAYSHNKYEELACQTIRDVKCLPTSILNHYKRGEWTVSLSGTPFHNIALDESHETVINRRLKELTSRPSEHRTVTLSNFMAYLDQFIYSFYKVIAGQRKPKTNKKSPQNEMTQAIWEEVKSKSLFSDSGRRLINVFISKAPNLDDIQISNLLSISSEGVKRMTSYIRQHILSPPLDVPTKIIRRKLRTFSKKRTTNRSQNSQMKKLSKISKGLTRQLQRSGHFYDRILEYPLAICDPFGELRDRHKYLFKEALMNVDDLKCMFVTQTPFNISQSETEVIIDALKFVHCPPPPDNQTFGDFASHLWNTVIMKHGFSRHAHIVTVVFDKILYCPPIRKLIHKERNIKTKKQINPDLPPIIADNTKIIHGQNFSTALKDSKFKGKLIDYLSTFFTAKAQMSLSPGQHLIVDSPTFDQNPVHVSNGQICVATDRCNNKGEADNGLWFHCFKSPCNQVLVVAGDTDVYMYGLALFGCGYFKTYGGVNKKIAVERDFKREFVDINLGVLKINDLPQLSHLSTPGCLSTASLHILSIYILSGSDYTSSFYKLRNKVILQTFLRYAEHISTKEDPLINVAFGNGKLQFRSISETAFIRLMCICYMEKHVSMFHHLYTDPVQLWQGLQLCTDMMSPDIKSFLEWLDFDTTHPVKFNDLPAWSDLVRRICYFDSKGNGDELYKLMLPSDDALGLHKARSQFVVKIAIDSVNEFSDIYNDIGEGWCEQNGTLSIRWEKDIKKIQKELAPPRRKFGNKCSCKPDHCTGIGRGCKNCAKSCKPCTELCKCKKNCKNPHNNGGQCQKCTKHTQGPENNSQNDAQSANDVTEMEIDESDQSDVDQSDLDLSEYDSDDYGDVCTLMDDIENTDIPVAVVPDDFLSYFGDNPSDNFVPIAAFSNATYDFESDEDISDYEYFGL